MALDQPLGELYLVASSLADELSFVALGDLSQIMSAQSDVSYRIIGGHMMTALALRWRLGSDLYRETGDVDVGIPLLAFRNLSLESDLRGLGYVQINGSRFERAIPELGPLLADATAPDPSSAIDILLPAYTSRPRANRRVAGHIVATEALGLATARQRPPIAMTLRLGRLDGSEMTANLLIPDEVAALTLKALVTTVRNKDTDLVDLWRCLEICRAAGVGPEEFSTSDDLQRAADVTRRLFTDRTGPGMRAIAAYQRLSDTGGDPRHTRIQALIVRVLGRGR